MYSSILRRIAQDLLLNHLPSQDLESGDTTKSGEKNFPWLEFDKNLQCAFRRFCKKDRRGLVRLELLNHSLTG